MRMKWMANSVQCSLVCNGFRPSGFRRQFNVPTMCYKMGVCVWVCVENGITGPVPRKSRQFIHAFKRILLFGNLIYTLSNKNVATIRHNNTKHTREQWLLSAFISSEQETPFTIQPINLPVFKCASFSFFSTACHSCNIFIHTNNKIKSKVSESSGASTPAKCCH